MTQVRFELNGSPVTARDEGQSLLQYLRGTACLNGAKNGCGTGQCGACTVLLDGRPVRSCVMPLARVEGKAVLTIEGLKGPDGGLHPIQKAFLDVGTVQCGFCTPGMVLATKALLDRVPDPTEEQICQALAANYCRCTGYVKIIEAVRLAAARLRGEEPGADWARTKEHTTLIWAEGEKQPAPGRVLGHALWDVDGPAKADGSLQYCNDMTRPDMLFGAFVWAPAPAGRLRALELDQARTMPGVFDILTGERVPGDNHLGTFEREQPVFCTERFAFLGDMLALVLADTEDHARAAAKAVRVEWDQVPGVYTIRQGLEEGAILAQNGRTVGDLDQARTRSAASVGANYQLERVEHGCLEPECALACYEQGLLTVYATTQSPFEIRRMLAAILALPEEQVRVVGTQLGGAFGSKCDAHVEAAAAVACAVTGRPVKVALDRRESLLLSTKRHAFETSYRVDVDSEGHILGLDAQLCSDAGPYDNLSTGVLMQACIFAGGPYQIPNLRVEGKAVRTNNVLGGAFRGFGINQGAICIETMLDEAARKLGMDPFEIRRRNALRPGASTVGGEVLRHSVGLLETIDACERLTKQALEEYRPRYPQGSKVLGVGVASGFKNVGVGKGVPDDGGCILTICEDGRLRMQVSGIDMGQGFRTAMLQLCAEATGFDPDQIDVFCGDTSATLPHGQAVGERQTLNSGRAVVEAAARLKEVCEKDPWQPGQRRSAQYRFVAPPTYKLEDERARREEGENYRNYPAYAYTTQAALVEVDKATGQVRVLKVIAAHDVGRAINPHIIEGQIQGSCSMGIGYALQEQFPSEKGVPLKLRYDQLGLPRAGETPDYEIALVEDPEPLGPFGAKGISEVATVPMTPAVLNAIYDAVGVRIRTLPATPQRILEALAQQEKTEEAVCNERLF